MRGLFAGLREGGKLSGRGGRVAGAAEKEEKPRMSRMDTDPGDGDSPNDERKASKRRAEKAIGRGSVTGGGFRFEPCLHPCSSDPSVACLVASVRLPYRARMPHLLDETPLDTPAGTLRELLAAARERLGQERIVVEVRDDGRVLPVEEIDERMLRPLGGASLELVSADPRTLAVSALDGALDELGALGGVQAEAADKLQADRPGAAFSLLGDALASWLRVSAVVTQCCELTGVELASLDAGGRTGEQAAKELATRLREVRTQIEAQDTISLADSLGYVWPEVVDRWIALVSDLQRRVS